MKIEIRKIVAQCWTGILARGPALLAWPSGTMAQPELRTRSARSPRVGAASAASLAA
jgi:hypothetical protein